MNKSTTGMPALALAAALVAVSVWLIVRARDDGVGYQRLSADEILSRVQRAIVAQGSYIG